MNVQLFGEMTAIENVLVGLHHSFSSSLLAVVLDTQGYSAEEAEARVRAASLLEFQCTAPRTSYKTTRRCWPPTSAPRNGASACRHPRR